MLEEEMHTNKNATVYPYEDHKRIEYDSAAVRIYQFRRCALIADLYG